LCHLTSSLRKSRRTRRPPSRHRVIQVKALPRHVTPVAREAKRSTLRTSPCYRGLLPPDKEVDGHTRGYLFCFSLSFSPFYPFTTNVTRALPLEAIKGEAGATSKGAIKQQQLEPTSIETSHHAPPLTRDLGSSPSLESL
jgi:hypothetical protein